MKKFFIITISILLIVTLGIYFVSGIIFEAAGHEIIAALKPLLKNQGISIDEYTYKSIRFSSLRTITVYDLHVMVKLQLPNLDNKSYSAYFYAEKLNLHLIDLTRTAFNVSCSNFRIYVENLKNIPGTSFARLDQGYIKFNQPIFLSQLHLGLKNNFQNMTNLFDENKLSTHIIMQALVTINLDSKNSQAHLYTIQKNGKTALQFKPEDIKNMASTFALELSDEEIAIIAQYPLRASTIVQITWDAQQTSRKAKKINRSVPEDAYRHVLWSYLLTRRFGPVFAQKVTNAHEILPTNTSAQRAMDFHNNRVGRDYALQGVSRERILWLVKNDKNVIKYPKEVT